MALTLKIRCCVVIVLLMASFQSMADTAIDARHFEDPVMAERYRDLTASFSVAASVMRSSTVLTSWQTIRFGCSRSGKGA